jgi:hypothetical protein
MYLCIMYVRMCVSMYVCMYACINVMNVCMYSFIYLLFCILHYYEVILHGMVVSYTISIRLHTSTEITSIYNLVK